MRNPTTVLAQLLELLPGQQFQVFVGQHNADRYTKSFSCWNQLTTLLYAQATEKDSLRDIETGLRILDSRWKGLDLRSVARSTIAYANEHRPAAIYESLFGVLLGKCQELSPDQSFSFGNPLRAIDSTTIDLCLSLFPWAKFRRAKGAIKLHTSLDVRSQIPDVVEMTTGKVGDVTALKQMDLSTFPKGTVFIFDLGYYDFALFAKITKAGHHFVTKLKENANIVRLGEHRKPVAEGVLKDERIGFALPQAIEKYPSDLRLVTYHDSVHDVTYEFLTDMFHLSAANIAFIYKRRWDIELFFKWLKQHLKIKTFLGTSKNAVLTQVWVAMIYFLLLKWLSSLINFRGSLLDLTRMIREVCLQEFPLIEVLCCTPKTLKRLCIRAGPQMSLF